MLGDASSSHVVATSVLAGLLWMLLLVNLTVESAERGRGSRLGATVTLTIVALAASLTVLLLLVQ